MLTEKKIQEELTKEFIIRRKHKIAVPNVFLYNWESDLLTINRNDYVSEYEIKISKWDYLKDFDKKRKHESFKRLRGILGLPNYFYYVCPENMIKLDDLPEYAGLIYLRKNYVNPIYVMRKAPILHKEVFKKWENIAIKLSYKLI